MRVLLLASLASVIAFASSAQAQAPEQAGDVAAVEGRTIQLRPSLRYMRSSGNDEVAHGFGLDLELRIFPSSRSPWRYGAFLSGDLLLDGSQRVAGGLTAGYGLFGIEVGVAQRTATDTFAASTGLHLAKTVTLGPVGVGFRMTIPLMSQRGQDTRLERGFEHAFRLSLGWSFDLVGQRPRMGGMCHGHGHGHHQGH